MRKNWFLTRDQEDQAKELAFKLFYSSWEFGRDCDSTCPDYANGFGVLQGLKEVGLIDNTEFHEWVKECKERAEKAFKEKQSESQERKEIKG